jgi:phage shock protein E
MIIDTREPYEFAAGHVDGAVNIPAGEFAKPNLPELLQNYDKNDEIILYCHSGVRANSCAQMLAAKGFTNITNGINEHTVAKLLKERTT